jgi:hypothetical protein
MLTGPHEPAQQPVAIVVKFGMEMLFLLFYRNLFFKVGTLGMVRAAS